MFRDVALEQAASGRLALHSMPGRRESIEEFQQALERAGIDRIVCLNDDTEIARKSPAYASALAAGAIACPRDVFPIPNLGVPADRQAFVELARGTAARVRAGERVLVHCGLGIGRTGTFACCVLIELGVPEPDARAAVRAAGGYPETGDQDKLIAFVARRVGSTIPGEASS